MINHRHNQGIDTQRTLIGGRHARSWRKRGNSSKRMKNTLGGDGAPPPPGGAEDMIRPATNGEGFCGGLRLGGGSPITAGSVGAKSYCLSTGRVANRVSTGHGMRGWRNPRGVGNSINVFRAFRKFVRCPARHPEKIVRAKRTHRETLSVTDGQFAHLVR